MEELRRSGYMIHSILETVDVRAKGFFFFFWTAACWGQREMKWVLWSPGSMFFQLGWVAAGNSMRGTQAPKNRRVRPTPMGIRSFHPCFSPIEEVKCSMPDCELTVSKDISYNINEYGDARHQMQMCSCPLGMAMATIYPPRVTEAYITVGVK